MEDGIYYVKQIIFHRQAQIVSNNSVQFPESFANLIRARILFMQKNPRKNSSCLFTAFLTWEKFQATNGGKQKVKKMSKLILEDI